jgi:calcium-dependent protein kinase
LQISWLLLKINKTLRETFLKLDKDKDGVLSKDDLLHGFANTIGNKVFLEAEIDKLLSQIDLNKNGVIDYSEFVTAASDFREMLTEENLKKCFNQLDLNGDSQIQFSELKELFIFNLEDEEEFKDLLSSLNLEIDGQINYEEFKRIMVSYIKRNSGPLCKLQEKTESDPFNINMIVQARKMTRYN